jgi:probable rRNA maturation factor
MLAMLQAAWRQYAEGSVFSTGAAVQINFVDKGTICRLHAEYFNDPAETDVITFPLPGPDLRGEVYICVDVAAAQARRFAISLDEELARLALHGVLHILGFDDLQPPARRRMRRLERTFLSKFSFIGSVTKAG